MDVWRSVVALVPKAIAFAAILVIGWLVAAFLRKWVDRLLERVGFDRAVEKGGIRRWLAQGKYDASSIVAALVYYAVLLFTLQLAFGLWGPNPVSELIEAVVAWLPRAAIAIVIVVIAAALATAVRDIISGLLAGLSYGRLLANLAGVFIIGLGVIAALGQVGIATTVTLPVLIAVLATVAGILIVGVGGGLVRPMQARWERWLSAAEQESHTVRERLQANARAREAASPAPSVEDTQVITPPPVTATARPVNSSVPTQMMPKVPAAAAPAWPSTETDEPADPGAASRPATEQPPPMASSEEAASGAAVQSTPTATASAPVPPPSADRPAERNRPAPKK